MDDVVDEPEMLRGVLSRFAPGSPAHVTCGKGWWPLLARLDRDIAALAPDYQLLQAKEKFGGLRYYIETLPEGPASDHVDQLIAQAEDESMRICEICGRAGTLRRGGWIATLCDEHAGGDDAP